MRPQRDRHDAYRVKGAPTQAQESDMQCQAQLVGCAVAGVNDLALSLAESEEGLQLEGAEFAG